MILAVGVGIAPFIQLLRSLLRAHDKRNARRNSLRNNNHTNNTNDSDAAVDADDIEVDLLNDDEEDVPQIDQIVVFYGVRTVKDILMREVLEEWQRQYSDILKIVFCVGSRWNNIHFGAKKKTEYIPPPQPEGFHALKDAEMGWISEDKILKHGISPSPQSKVLVCGLPGIYDKLCGKREAKELSQDSVLYNLGFGDDMVVKL